MSGWSAGAEPVGLVVGDQVAGTVRARHPEHDVDRAGQVAAQRLAAEPRRPRAGRRRGAADRRPARCRRSSAPTSARVTSTPGAMSPPASGISKSSSQSRSAQRRSPPASARGQRAERGVVERHQRRRERRRGHVDRPPGPLLLDLARAARPPGRARPGRSTSSTPCTSEPNAAPDGRSAIGEAGAPARRRPAAARHRRVGRPARRRARRRARTARAREVTPAASSAARISAE